MNRKKLSFILSLAVLPSLSGCATTSGLWDRSVAVFRKPAATDVAEPTTEADLSPEFKAARKTFKHTEQTMLAWARYQEDIGEYAEARKKYRELLVAYPECAEASIGLARIEQSTGRSQQAEQILTELEQRQPSNVAVKLELGRLYSDLDRLPEAVNTLERAVELNADNQESRYALGVALARGHQFDPALAHLTFAVGESAAHYNIGHILHEEGHDEEAVEWLRNALAAHPNELVAEKTRVLLSQLSPAQDMRRDQTMLAASRHNSISIEAAPANNRGQLMPRSALSPPYDQQAHVQPSYGQYADDQRAHDRQRYEQSNFEQNEQGFTDETPLEPAMAYYGDGVDEVSLPPVTNSGAQSQLQSRRPMRTVSWSQQAAEHPYQQPESQPYQQAAPQQWNGPNNSQPSAQSPHGTVQPPQWRR